MLQQKEVPISVLPLFPLHVKMHLNSIYLTSTHLYTVHTMHIMHTRILYLSTTPSTLF
ncbi:hypothetical protein BCR41DRAFT_347925 [Lobosporangium transversale]|uniref:Uncharacterized protein n=1 Tax=Lobosporangium transversale TaxID=64571 RepID=A0A1Y2GZ87_9FUNG|nr:hypothetical protein BCR41DRAFT_347925 [Lobosporangium transversale]ORZ26783.1 hypothetical protein BCR41DRAFT_347925 [Lobosporangium transversale]|eukprot:XP_021884546.1 hypothetical protein BCR41DRAFT_347925 [Lobosporangium transversale]